MAAAEERFRRRLFVGILVVSFGFIILNTLFPSEIHNGGLWILNWIFTHIPVGWIFLIGVLGTTALIIVGGTIMIYEKLKAYAA